jgi:hypothetical protein
MADHNCEFAVRIDVRQGSQRTAQQIRLLRMPLHRRRVERQSAKSPRDDEK